MNSIADPPLLTLVGIGPAQGFARLGRGLLSLLMIPFFLVGKWYGGLADRLDDPAREIDGLTFVLTGVQGRSLLEQQISLGIADAGLPGRIEIIDWTTGNPLRFLQHLRGRDMAAEAAVHLAERIVAFRQANPRCPVHLVGYSGGGYVALLTLEALPPGVAVTSASLLAPSVSPQFDAASLSAKTERRLTHYRSPFDIFVLGALTAVVGTTDGRHSPSAGLVGFKAENPAEAASNSPRFRECRFRFRWLTQFHYSGHFGYANRVWACETLGRQMTSR